MPLLYHIAPDLSASSLHVFPEAPVTVYMQPNLLPVRAKRLCLAAPVHRIHKNHRKERFGYEKGFAQADAYAHRTNAAGTNWDGTGAPEPAAAAL
jgi:hypothetical protein